VKRRARPWSTWHDRAVRSALAFVHSSRLSPVVHLGGVARLSFVRAMVEALPAWACPCQGELDDPGGWHLPACPFSDPSYPDGVPF